MLELKPHQLKDEACRKTPGMFDKEEPYIVSPMGLLDEQYPACQTCHNRALNALIAWVKEFQRSKDAKRGNFVMIGGFASETFLFYNTVSKTFYRVEENRIDEEDEHQEEEDEQYVVPS